MPPGYTIQLRHWYANAAGKVPESWEKSALPPAPVRRQQLRPLRFMLETQFDPTGTPAETVQYSEPASSPERLHPDCVPRG